MKKIIRTICLFKEKPEVEQDEAKLRKIESILVENGYEIQTKRVCFSNGTEIQNYGYSVDEIGYGIASYNQLNNHLGAYIKNKGAINLNLTNEEINEKHVQMLFNIIKASPEKTFEFNYSFNLPPSSPYFPSGNFQKPGFSIGLQPTNLSKDCESLDEWFSNMSKIWQEIIDLFGDKGDFLGIDSSIASLYTGESSLINFVKRLDYDFKQSVTTDIYTKITKYIKEKNPKPIGLCGLMFPCLEDFELADEYEKGEFLIERNLFLSLHSGLGIDTYPIGIDEKHERVVGILKLVQALSNKYSKPLSVRFVSDGKAKIGEKTDFRNKYLKDVVVKTL